MPQRDIRLHSAVGIAILCFASNSVMSRLIVSDDLASPAPLTLIRFLAAAGSLLLLSRLFPESFHLVRIKPSHLAAGLLLSVYGFSISFGFMFIGAAAGTLVSYASNVIAMSMLGVFAEKERLGRTEVLGHASAVLGVFVITFGGIEHVTVIGVLLMIATGVSWGVWTVHGKRFPDPFSYSAYSFIFMSTFGSVGLIALLLTVPGLILVQASVEGLGLGLFMGAVTTALSYVLWQRTMFKIKSSQGGLFLLMSPVVAGVMGVILLKEQLAIPLVLGGAMIMAGIYLNRRR